MNKLAIAFAALCAATPLAAQVTTAQITAGMQVYDNKSQAVGVVTKVDKGMATVVTGKHAVPLNPASFALDHGKLYLSMSRDALDRYYETNVMPAEMSLAVGKPVKGLEGSTLGTIQAIDDSKVVVLLTSGQPIQLPRTGIIGAADGATVGVSAADLARQLAPSTPAAGPVPPAAHAGTTAH